MRRLSILFLVMIAALQAWAQPAFKGGRDALIRFIDTKIVYPEYSRQNCISGTVQVSFGVDADGRVTNVKVQKGMGIDLDDEAMRVIRLTSGKWTVPANSAAGLRIVLPVTFKPDGVRCASVPKATIKAAADNYRTRRELENVVTTYYKNKQQGKTDKVNEANIERLKLQLGFNDDFIERQLQQAQEKLNQGDTTGACEQWQYLRSIGSNRADDLISKYCGE